MKIYLQWRKCLEKKLTKIHDESRTDKGIYVLLWISFVFIEVENISRYSTKIQRHWKTWKIKLWKNQKVNEILHLFWIIQACKLNKCFSFKKNLCKKTTIKPFILKLIRKGCFKKFLFTLLLRHSHTLLMFLVSVLAWHTKNTKIYLSEFVYQYLAAS